MTASVSVSNSEGKKLASNKVLWLFAVGQLGWSMLSGIISNWLVYFYQPGSAMLSQGQQLFITQGAVFAGITIIGLITASGRIFDAFTDPWIASKSDRCRHRLGRRVPFLRYAAIPFGAVTVLIFCSPVEGVSWVNNLVLCISVLAFYLCMTCYCTPYNALIPELGRTQKLRINVSTYISVTYFFGTAFAYLVPNLAGFFEPSLGVTAAFRVTIAILAVIAVVCMLVPSFAIKEHEYAVTTPSSSGAVKSLGKTFKNKEFRTFVTSDVLYWIALTMFQTGLPFYITELMGLDDSMTFPLFALMTVMSFVFYVPVNIAAKRLGKKKLVVFAFLFFTVAFAVTTVVGLFGVPGLVWGILVAILASIPMAILGILPQAIVADIAEADAITSGEKREGMFYAARTFAFKLGQSVSMLLFTSIALIGTAGVGYRLTALVAAVFCLLGGLQLMRYNEKKVFDVIGNDLDGTAKGAQDAVEVEAVQDDQNDQFEAATVVEASQQAQDPSPQDIDQPDQQ